MPPCESSAKGDCKLGGCVLGCSINWANSFGSSVVFEMTIKVFKGFLDTIDRFGRSEVM